MGDLNGSALDPQGPGAQDIATLWWVMVVVAILVFGVVLVLLLAAVLRRRGGEEAPSAHGTARARWLVLGGGVVAPALLLVALFVWMLDALGTSAPASPSAGGVAIAVAARQWFWDVTYDGGVRDANELHIPVGVPVTIRLTSQDVVHSLWIPALNGKLDAVPGRTNTLHLQADHAGVYAGRCGEFCGLQHAHMGLVVVAQERGDFEEWLARQRGPRAPPADADAERGEQVFLGSACVYCHTIAGTNASGRVGPDLTHLASRRTLAAGTMLNAPGNLAGWILDPQHVKPGNAMPGTDLQGEELQALLAYLEGLR